MKNHRARISLSVAGAVALVLASSDSAAQDAATMLGEIIVTAQKRAENARTVPGSVSVVGQSQLENFHVTQLSDVAGYVPGLQLTSLGTPGQQAITLRGIAPISPGANVGTYIDETPLGSSGIFQRETIFQLDLLPYDVERIEVLRGPQGTLYGAGSMGGRRKYVTRSRDLGAYECRAGGGGSDAEGADDLGSILRFGANLPLVQGRFALRASYARNDVAGHVDNDQSGAQDINDLDQETARLSALWQLNDDAILELTGMTQAIDSDNNANVALDPATLRPLNPDPGNLLSVDEPFEKDIDFYAATLIWGLGAAEFVSATGYSDIKTDQRVDATLAFGGFPTLIGLPPGVSFFDLGLEVEKITQEFRLTSTGSAGFRWQLGAFYTEEDADNSQVISLQALDGTPTPILDPLAALMLPTDYTELAFFANGSYDLTERLELGAGIRHASNDQDFWQVVTGGIILPIGVTPGTSDEDVITWMLTPKWQLSDDTMLYARIATGYQPGGPNVALPGVPPTVDSSELTSYEVGLKADLAGERLRLDIAVFYIDWDDIQIVDSDGVTSWLINGGTAESQGIELAALFGATDRLRLGLNATYTDATATNDVPSLGGLDGDRLPYVPELALSVTTDYSFPIGEFWQGRIGGGYRWLDDRSTGLESNPGSIQLDSYGVLDVNADVSNDHWTFRAYSKNLTDERNYSNIAQSLGGLTPHFNGTLIRTRTYGVEVDYRF